MLLARRFLASIMAILTIPIFIVLVFFSNLAINFSDPHFYNKHLIQANVYEHISYQIIPDLVEKSDIPDDEIYRELSFELLKVLDPQWFQTNIELSLSQLIPYLSGNKEEFEIEISLEDRTEAALVALNTKFKEPKYYDLFIANVLLPILHEETRSIINENIGIELSENELTELVASSITQKEYEAILDTAFDSVTPYILGEKDSFSIKIQMKDKWEQSLSNLVLLADRKLTNIFYNTPKCSSQELALEQLKDIDTSTPEFLFDGSLLCFPPDLEYKDAKSLMSIRIGNVLSDSLIDQMPPYITLTSSTIPKTQEEVLHFAREYSTLKITLDDKQFLESAFQNNPHSIEQFNFIRSSISNTPKPGLIIWAFVIITLITSLIGGRFWLGAIQWAATITAITSALIIFAIMAIRMVSSQFETIITDTMGELITNSNGSVDIILHIFNNVVLELATPIQTQFLYWFIVSLITLLMPLLYGVMHKRLRT